MENTDKVIIKEEKQNNKSIGQNYGKCKWFSDKNGYGFITKLNDDENKDIFVHFSGIKPIVSNNYKTLLCGEYLSFDITYGNNGQQAVNVSGINGGPLMCDNNNISNITPKKNINLSESIYQNKPSTGTYYGRCKWFNEKSGYGFITIESEQKKGQDVFIHYTGIQPLISKYRTLVSGEYVSFDIINGVKDLQAVNVQGFNGNTLLCDVNHIPNTIKTSKNNNTSFKQRKYFQNIKS